MAAKKTVIGISSSPGKLSPFSGFSYYEQNLNRLLHRALFKVSREMKIICDLCASFRQYHDDQGYYVELTLQDNLQFTNGKKIDLEAVKQAIKYYQDEEIKSVFRGAFIKIKKVVSMGPRLILTYDHFYEDALSDLTLLKIVHRENNQWIGAGNYLLESADEKSIFLKERKKGNILHFKVIKDETTALFHFMKNNLDLYLGQLSPRKINWIFKKNSQLKAWSKTSVSYKYIGINFLNEHLKDLKLRKTLAKNFPVQEYIDSKFKGHAEKADNILPSSFSEFVRQEEKNSSAKKEEELTPKKKYTFKIIYTNKKENRELVKFLEHYWQKVGVTLKKFPLEWGTYSRELKLGNFDLYIANWVGFTGPSIYHLALHGSHLPPKGRNRGRYNDQNFNQLLEQAVAQPIYNKRKEIYFKVIDYFKKEIPYISLWHPKVVWVGKNCLHNLSLFPNGSFDAFIGVENGCSD